VPVWTHGLGEHDCGVSLSAPELEDARPRLDVPEGDEGDAVLQLRHEGVGAGCWVWAGFEEVEGEG